MADLIITVTCPKCHHVIESTQTGNLYERLERINLDDPCDACRSESFTTAERVLRMRKAEKHIRKKGWWR
jgi:hypothetical protein